MSGHTPGQWSRGTGKRFHADLNIFAAIATTDCRFRVARACYEVGSDMIERDEAAANARLIAAAPDLLAALKAHPEDTSRLDDWWHFTALPAIAKAEGRE